MTAPAIQPIPVELLAPGTAGAPFVRVASLADIPRGALLRVTRGEAGLVATDDRCPHMGAPLSIGRLDGCVVACPLHRGRFDLGTGEVVQFPTTGGLSADGLAHAAWSPPGSPAKPEPSDEKALARALTRVRRLRYYPLRVVDDAVEVALPR